MKQPDLNRHTTPPGGWFYAQPQTGWKTPTPIASTFDQTVRLIIGHRRGNPALTAKHGWSLDIGQVGNELEEFTRKRLGITTPMAVPKTRPLRSFVQAVGDVAEDKETITQGIKRAAAGTAVVLDWLTSGGHPVEQELANKRAEVCVNCPKNEIGSWYTVAPAEIIRSTLGSRGELKLETPFDNPTVREDGTPRPGLLSCKVCKCLNRLKVWVPLSYIVQHTKPEVMREFPQNCWIFKRDQI